MIENKLKNINCVKTKIIKATNSGVPATVPIVRWSVDLPRIIRIRHQPEPLPQPLNLTPKTTSGWNFLPSTARHNLQQTL